MNAQEKYREYVITSMVASIEPVTLIEGEGAVVVDETGKSYVDGFSGISVTNVGHGAPEVAAAAKAQIEKLVHCNSYMYHVQPVADLAEKLAEITPGRLKKTFFANSGAEALEGAMRITKQHTKKHEFVALQMAFHGRTLGTLSITGNSGRKKGGGPYMPGVAFHPAPYCYRCPFGLTYPSCELKCATELGNTVKFATSGDVAAFVAEPVLGEAGIVTPPEGYFQKVKEVCDEQDMLLLVDEVQTGFGRCGEMFAIEASGVEPDVMTMAKGIANGFPLGAFTVSDEIATAFRPGDHLSTFGGNPVSCAAAIATIGVMEKRRLPQEAKRKGQATLAALRTLQARHSMIGDVRGMGLMIGLEMIADAGKTPAAAAATRVRTLCRERGLLVGVGGVYGNVVRFQPPLVITDAQIEQCVSILDWALGQVGDAVSA
ncbi:MAG: aspartate aminotransferase family protein [Armatimonadetes bacterium]|nr:aspartate aminotransferase family protein [Armatimonadota bacterium]